MIVEKPRKSSVALTMCGGEAPALFPGKLLPEQRCQRGMKTKIRWPHIGHTFRLDERRCFRRRPLQMRA